MDGNLPRLARELRQEKCPRRVLDEVERRIGAQVAPPTRFGYAIPVTAAGLVMLCCLGVWRWRAGGHADWRPKAAASASLDRGQIAEQAEGALDFIGSIVLEAGARSQRVIFNGAVPPVRNSLETAKHKIIKRIEL